MSEISLDIKRDETDKGIFLNGKGKVVFKNGNSYDGIFQNGMFHGNGVFCWANGVKFTGNFD